MIAEKGPLLVQGSQIAEEEIWHSDQIVEGSHMFPLERPEETVYSD